MLEANYDKTKCNVLERVNSVTFDKTRVNKISVLVKFFAVMLCVIHKNWIDRQMRQKRTFFAKYLSHKNITSNYII